MLVGPVCDNGTCFCQLFYKQGSSIEWKSGAACKGTAVYGNKDCPVCAFENTVAWIAVLVLLLLVGAAVAVGAVRVRRT